MKTGATKADFYACVASDPMTSGFRLNITRLNCLYRNFTYSSIRREGASMILAIDQGTTGTTVNIFDETGDVRGRGYSEFRQIFPQPSWVEHDPNEIWQVTMSTIQLALDDAGVSFSDIACVGITNQRETTVLWDRNTGEPVHNAIVWQCRRTTDLCNKLKADNKASWIQDKTGLVVDAYFSATKIQWILNQNPEVKQAAERGDIAFGTIDSWLIWKLTGGEHHVTDHTNAARTMLYNIKDKSWDAELLDYFHIPSVLMPTIRNSTAHFGMTDAAVTTNVRIPITGVAGDQQAALFGQQCVNPGQVKNTYGTGCFMLMFMGQEYHKSEHGLLTTIACDAHGEPAYALEGAVFIAGAAIQWLRDSLGIIDKASQTEEVASSLPDTKGVYFVPAFTGLGAPHWDMDARGAILGLTRGTGKNEIIRAALEAIAYQTTDVLKLMQSESNMAIESMHVDGGASANSFLMQFQSNLLNIDVFRPQNVESTLLGAALLAGIGAKFWDADALPEQIHKLDRVFTPNMTEDLRTGLMSGWRDALNRVKTP